MPVTYAPPPPTAVRPPESEKPPPAPQRCTRAALQEKPTGSASGRYVALVSAAARSKTKNEGDVVDVGEGDGKSEGEREDEGESDPLSQVVEVLDATMLLLIVMLCEALLLDEKDGNAVKDALQLALADTEVDGEIGHTGTIITTRPFDGGEPAPALSAKYGDQVPGATNGAARGAMSPSAFVKFDTRDEPPPP